MTILQTGEELNQTLSSKLLRQLQKQAARYDLDIPEMEELTQLASTAMESPTLSFARQTETFRAGLKGSPTILSEPDIIDAAATALLQTAENVRYAVVIRKPGKPVQARIFFQ